MSIWILPNSVKGVHFLCFILVPPVVSPPPLQRDIGGFFEHLDPFQLSRCIFSLFYIFVPPQWCLPLPSPSLFSPAELPDLPPSLQVAHHKLSSKIYIQKPMYGNVCVFLLCFVCIMLCCIGTNYDCLLPLNVLSICFKTATTVS